MRAKTYLIAVIGLQNKVSYFMVKYAMRPSNCAVLKMAKKCAVSKTEVLAGRLARAMLL